MKKIQVNRVISLAENWHFRKSASIAFVWSNAYIGLAQTPLQTERARIEGFSPLILALVFLSVDMWASPTRYVLALLELDILSLRANSIWDKSLVCAENISSASAHIERHRRISKIPRGIYLDAWYSVKSITLWVGGFSFNLKYLSKDSRTG